MQRCWIAILDVGGGGGGGGGCGKTVWSQGDVEAVWSRYLDLGAWRGHGGGILDAAHVIALATAATAVT